MGFDLCGVISQLFSTCPLDVHQMFFLAPMVVQHMRSSMKMRRVIEYRVCLGFLIWVQDLRSRSFTFLSTSESSQGLQVMGVSHYRHLRGYLRRTEGWSRYRNDALFVSWDFNIISRSVQRPCSGVGLRAVESDEIFHICL